MCAHCAKKCDVRSFFASKKFPNMRESQLMDDGSHRATQDARVAQIQASRRISKHTHTAECAIGVMVAMVWACVCTRGTWDERQWGCFES